MRLIDAEKIEHDIAEWIEREYEIDECNAEMLSKVLRKIKQEKAIETEHMKHGKWITDETSYRFRIVCSNCGESNAETEYCPNCGAKMD